MKTQGFPDGLMALHDAANQELGLPTSAEMERMAKERHDAEVKALARELYVQGSESEITVEEAFICAETFVAYAESRGKEKP